MSFSTNQKIAILDAKGGISIDTYSCWEDLLRDVAYRVCAQDGYNLHKLNLIVEETRQHIENDTAEAREALQQS